MSAVHHRIVKEKQTLTPLQTLGYQLFVDTNQTLKNKYLLNLHKWNLCAVAEIYFEL